MPTKQLDIGQIAEVRDLYDGTRASVVELSKLFNVNFCVIAYLVNHRGYRDSCIRTTRNWRKNNPEKWREISRRAGKKYRESNEYRIYVEKNRDKINARSRKYYQKNRDRITAKVRERYWKKKKENKLKVENTN